MKFPVVHSNHTLEEKSILFFRNHLPTGWVVNTVDKDYGQDLNIEIAEDGMLKGLDLIIQLKSSHQSDTSGENERQTFKVSTYNYLTGNVRAVMIVKYVEEENEAYWVMLKDVPEPNQDNETFTMYLPRKNKLTTIQWGGIVNYIREVTDTMKEVSVALYEVFDTGRFIKGAFDLAAIYDNRWQKFIKKITEKVKPENLTKGHPQIVIPAMEGLNLQYEDSLLSELFINLLANSMDSTKQEFAHPAFNNIITQLSYDEAVIVFFLKKYQTFAIRILHNYVGQIDLTKAKAEYNLEEIPLNKLTFPDMFQTHVEHLKHLSLCDYRTVDKKTEFGDNKYKINTLSYEYTLIVNKTQFGILFFDACIPDEFQGL